MKETVSLQDLQRDPNTLLNRVEAGEHLVVVPGGRPVAELRPVPATQSGPRPFGLCAGTFTVPDDFDAPLPEEIPAGFRVAMRHAISGATSQEPANLRTVHTRPSYGQREESSS